MRNRINNAVIFRPGFAIMEPGPIGTRFFIFRKRISACIFVAARASLPDMDNPNKSLHDYLVLLGAKGGRARAAALTPARRKAISAKALAARWAGHIAKRPSRKA